MVDQDTEIKQLLQTFSRLTNERIRAYMNQLPADQHLKLRFVLEDITVYKDPPPEELSVFVEGEVHS